MSNSLSVKGHDGWDDAVEEVQGLTYVLPYTWSIPNQTQLGVPDADFEAQAEWPGT